MGNIVDSISSTASKASGALSKGSSVASGAIGTAKGAIGKASELMDGVSDMASCVADSIDDIAGAIDSALGIFDDVMDAVEGIMDAFEDVPKLLESRFVGGPKDILAVADVYEITENALRTRASELIDGVLGKLLDLAKIPFDIFDNCFKPIIDFFKAVFDFLKKRIAALLGALPPGVAQSIGDIKIDYDLLGYAKLDLFWDYANVEIPIKPGAVGTYNAVTALLNANRGTANAAPLSQAIDQTAEIAVFSQLVRDMLKNGLNPPIGEVLTGLTSDTVREAVAIRVFPDAINPRNSPGPGPTTLLDQNPNTYPLPTTETTLHRPDTIIGDNFTGEKPGSTLLDLNPWGSDFRGEYPTSDAGDLYTAGDPGDGSSRTQYETSFQPPITPTIDPDAWIEYQHWDPSLIDPNTGLPYETLEDGEIRVDDYLSNTDPLNSLGGVTGNVFQANLRTNLDTEYLQNPDYNWGIAPDPGYQNTFTLPDPNTQRLSDQQIRQNQFNGLTGVQGQSNSSTPLSDQQIWQNQLDNFPGIRDQYPNWESLADSTISSLGWSYEAIEELLRHLTPEQLLARYPGLIRMLLYFYKLPTKEYTLEAEYTRFVNLLTRIKASWYRITRDATEVGWLTYIAYSSGDAIHLFTATPTSEIRDEVLIASTYRDSLVPQLLKAQYPLAAI
jgi:hypothetical protein